jgi:hypothetical protein
MVRLLVGIYSYQKYHSDHDLVPRTGGSSLLHHLSMIDLSKERGIGWNRLLIIEIIPSEPPINGQSAESLRDEPID